MQNPTDRIQLRFNDFALQANDNTDYLIVYDGKDEENDKMFGTFYGNKMPPSMLESSSNWITIVFHSDDSFSEKGFNITFQKKGETNIIYTLIDFLFDSTLYRKITCR
jgi:hypothetical protein